MSAPLVKESEAIHQMIADLSDLPTQPIVGTLSNLRSRSILRSLIRRIDSEPARVCTDPDGRIVWINPAFSHLCGHTFQDLKGRKPGTILQGPESSPESVNALREAIRNRIPCVTELVNYHKDRSAYRVRIELRPLISATGKLTGYEAREWKLE